MRVFEKKEIPTFTTSATDTQKAPIIHLVDQILTSKRTTPNADISSIEKEIDQMVNLLYGLMTEKIETRETQIEKISKP